jgi:hypothetical protein
VSPPLVSCSTKPVRAQLLRAAQGQTRSSPTPRSPLPSTPLLSLSPSGEGAATSRAIIDECTACIATNPTCHCFPLCRWTRNPLLVALDESGKIHFRSALGQSAPEAEEREARTGWRSRR